VHALPTFFSPLTISVLQIIGGALGISAAQAAFVNRMSSTLASTAPGISPLQVIATGATEIRKVFPTEIVPGVIRAYMEGIKVAFALSVTMAGLSFVLSLGMDFKRLPANRKTEVVVA
jgi:hypothetical protein